MDRILVPVIGELLEHDAVLLDALDELEGSGAYRLQSELVAGFGRSLRAYDHAGTVRELRNQRREGSLEQDLDRQRIGDLDPVDGRKLGAPERALQAHVALEAELHSRGIHGLAIVELDAGSQLDGDRLAVLGRLMRERELGNDVHLRIDVEELVAQ